MFGNLASDVLGLSDLGKIIDSKNFDKTDIDEYVFTEDGEKIYAIIKSLKDEYCFTNVAFIHLDGATATSKRRLLSRYSYKHFPISHVHLETAGTVDLDAEIKFNYGDKNLSIDIDKSQIDKIRDIYKALVVISEKCHEIKTDMNTLEHTHDVIFKMFTLRELSSENAVLNLPDIINQTCQQVESHYNTRKSEIRNYDFSAVFARYIKW
jgi:hypothetical protein